MSPGDGPGQTICLHGWMGSREDWEGLDAALGEAHRLDAVDLPGHGRAPDCSLETFEAELRTRTRGLPFDLIAYSMGGRIALMMDGLNVRRLVLIGAHPGLQTESERIERSEVDARRSAKLLEAPTSFLAAWQGSGLFGASRSEDWQALHRRRASTAAERAPGWAKTLERFSLARQPDCWGRRGGTKTLYLAGEWDARYVAIGRRLADEHEQVSFELIAEAAHAAHLDQPGSSAIAIAAFLS